jgi:UDP-N-acetylmuramoyl-tripeptide--D-alanyl-D-alanine ligase
MEPRPLNYVAESCRGELLNGSPELTVSRVCTDSRQAQPGDLFVALVGEKFDAHDFLAEVMEKGAVAMVANKSRVSSLPPGRPAVMVDNTRKALGQLAARYRHEFSLPVVAVGGSNGKTTTKDLIAAVLRQKFSTLWSESSFNNDIGVPMTLLKLHSTHGALVQEVGTNHPGELAPLVRMLQPRYGVITSIGREHLEFFGDVNGVAQEEGCLAELLPAEGKLFVNGDSPHMEQVTFRTKAAVVRVGFGNGNDWQAHHERLTDQGTAFRVTAPQQDFCGDYALKLLGRHQIGNALLALAVGAELGLTREQMQRALAGCTPPKMRLQLWEHDGVRVLDDSYNANADSVIAALQTLHDLPCAGRRIAVLGDMAELGQASEAAHREVGDRAAQLGINQIIAVGHMAGLIGHSARGAGVQSVQECSSVELAVKAVKDSVRTGDVVLVKASRSSRLERVAEALRGESNV